jgi:phosphoribosylformylglycinamidine cyclo-ligase
VLLERAGRSLDDPAYDGSPTTLADELLLPSVIYSPAIQRLLRRVDVHAIAHITGGGMEGNVNRFLPVDADAVIWRREWEPPRIFDEIQRLGDVSTEEMAKVFNLGIGMVVAVPPADRYKALDTLREAGHHAIQIGEVVAGHGAVQLVD